MNTPTTLGELKQQVKHLPDVRTEMRLNLIRKLKNDESIFSEVIGYDVTVLPALVNAILCGHNIILLGERGQGKSRIIRSMIDFLDEQMPAVAGCPIHDSPFSPICSECKQKLKDMGDQLPVDYIPREKRLIEKLATSDVSTADLIGEVDPIKVAQGRTLDDESSIHFGLVPRAHRSLFAINELPDLAEKIQVAFFNIMEENDFQIKGFPVRLPLDTFIVATANPEDYTSRGRIITPLKDRFDVQIRTHYPLEMKSFRYKKWDGSQEPFELNRKSIVDTFLDNIIKGMDPRTSLARMMWSGFPLAGMNFRVMGLEEMVQELQQQVEDLFATYHLENAFDQPINDFKNLLSREQFDRREKGLPSAPSYEQLPAGLLEKLQQLENFDFSNNDSRQIFAHWQNRRADILDLYEFYSAYAAKFTGHMPADFDQAIELMRLLKSIEKIQNQIMTGRFSTIDPRALQEILGENAARSFNILLELPQMMTAEGIVDSLQQGFDMTPRGMRALGELAFGKIYRHIKRDQPGNQSGNAPHSGEIEPDSSRRYRYGDRFDLDISKTILNAVSMGRCHQGQLSLSPEDFQIREREQLITSTTVVLLDLSWSMSWEGRFEAAKKVALALNHYIRARFPKDKLHIVGFCTEAHELKGSELALAQWDPARPFTNLQDGLRLAMQLIKKSGNRNNRVIVITDGQPTAYFDRDQLHVELPNDFFGLSPNACKATLAEVRRVTAQGMKIETFMLDDNPVLVEFTRELTRINGGRAVLCLPGELGKLILIEEIKRRGRTYD